MNVICDESANGAVARYLSEGRGDDKSPQFLPFEKAAIVLDGIKLTTDVGAEVQYCQCKKDAKRFYTKPRNVLHGTNRGGLGGSSEQLYSVAWTALDAALTSKPDMFQIWLSKQCIGICTTRSNLAHIQALLDNKCPNRTQPKETSKHLNRCPNGGRTLLFQDRVASIVKWMQDYNRTDAELAHWLEKYRTCYSEERDPSQHSSLQEVEVCRSL